MKDILISFGLPRLANPAVYYSSVGNPIVYLHWAPSAPICCPFHLTLTSAASHPPDLCYTTKTAL